MRSENQVAKYMEGVPGKAAIACMGPVPKPTQVDKERILRPTGEVSSRNSAKRPRNFGRRGARVTWPQRIGSGNCLAKT